MKNKYLFILLGIICVMSITLTVNLSLNSSSRVVMYHGDQLLVSIDGNVSSRFPSSGNYYLASYDCSSKNTIVTWDRESYQLSVTNHNKKGNVSCYLNFKSNPKLADMEEGSFVQYVGNNGCVGNQCQGQNANYGGIENKGYCGGDSSQFYYDGWRIAYVKNGTAYLVSAGSVECMCTDSNGNENSSCDSSVNSANLSNHMDNLDKVALKYCNTNYVYGGVCDISTSRNINQDDFLSIIHKGLNINSCYQNQSKKCGYVNDLIDIGSNYWYSTVYDNLSDKVLYWSSNRRTISNSMSGFSYGVRPIIRMDANVVVVGGSGTYEDPYQISNYAFSTFQNDTMVNLKMIGYQVNEMCIALNSTVCTNYVPFQENYTLDISGLKNTDNVIYVYYKDNDGNIVAVIDRIFSLK